MAVFDALFAASVCPCIINFVSLELSKFDPLILAGSGVTYWALVGLDLVYSRNFT